MKPAPKSGANFDYELIAELYLEALELPTAERTAFLRERAGGNERIVRQVESLLASPGLDSFLEKPIVNSLSLESLKNDFAVPKLHEGDRIGNFTILGELGQGGFATVYLAHDVSLGRDVAIKVSRNSGEEARILAPLDHDHIVKVYSESVEQEGRIRIICMQYIQGTTLAGLISALSKHNEPLSGASIIDALRRSVRSHNTQATLVPGGRVALGDLEFEGAVLNIGIQLAGALAYAHRKKVLHLDVKPSNLLINRSGRPFLSDFNVSWSLKEKKAGKEITVGGTFNYMAPEHRAVFTAKDRSAALAIVDHRADIYSLGKVLKEFLGLAPLLETSEDVIRALEKSTAPNADDRFQTAAELASALEGCYAIHAIRRQNSIQIGGFIDHDRPFFKLKLMGLAPLVAASMALLWYLWGVGISPARPLLIASLGALAASFLALQSVFTGRLRPLIAFVKEPRKALKEVSRARPVRAELLELPSRIFFLYSFLWLPAQVMSSVLVHYNVESVPTPLWGRVLILQVVTGLTAAAFSAVGAYFIVLVYLYHYFWVGEDKVRQLALEELGDLPARLRIYYSMTVLLPFIAAALLVLDPWQSWRSVPGPVCSFLVVGVMGIYFSFRVSHRVAQVIFTFSGRSGS